MIAIRWTEGAAADLKTIADYLFERSPQHAGRIVHSSTNLFPLSSTFLFAEEKEKKRGTRELVLAPLPYVSIYRIDQDAIQIVKILHGAQKSP